MLKELRISDFAIIDRLELRFEAGFVAFTGETGAGKSIIIDAVEALMGGRTDTSMIRLGADRAVIEGDFRIQEAVRDAVIEILRREDLLDSESMITLGREIRTEGRHVARINGRSVTVGLLKEVGEYLVDVHGQSEHLSLLRTREHLRLLDGFAGLETARSSYRECYTRLRRVQTELEELRRAEQDAARRADLLEYQIAEIESAALKPDEEDDLRQERNRLANAESLSTLAQEALFAIDETTPENQSASDLLGKAVHALNQTARLDPSQTETAARIQELFEGLTDAALELRDYIDSIEFNARRLEEVEERLDLIQNLKRKYGGSIRDVIGSAARASEELESITTAGERMDKLQNEAAALRVQLARLGEDLSAQRRRAAGEMSRALEIQLKDLRMNGARFDVEFQRKPDPEGVELSGGETVAFGPDGLETIQFLVAPNMGEGLKPLAKIASGGEMSRLMLALKHVLAQADLTPTLIFDEIDQGIGGRVGAVIGGKLSELARRHQVLCITHLPQLAAYGTQHYRVLKQVDGGRTVTVVETLSGDARVKELAQMLGDVSPATLESAREMLQTVSLQAGRMGE
ncbi:MAG TPA: DNA repair protein RecN [Anaerolineales bacterium]|nr:DNA repair protein RecN [Anaerolineales bacterium]